MFRNYLFEPIHNIWTIYLVCKFSNGPKLNSDVDPEGSSPESSNGDIYPENGTELDRTQYIADKYHNDKEGLDKYFLDKENAIRASYRQDSNSAAISGVQAAELDNWMRQRDNLLEELHDQKEDAYNLADIPVSNSDTEQSAKSTSDNEVAESQDKGEDSSLVDDFADSSQEMPSYMDPEN